MEEPTTWRTHDWLSLGFVMLATAGVCLPGIEVRDLTGDELGALGRNVAEMLNRSIEVDRPEQFSAHLPLAWLLRAGFHHLFGAENAWVWRLHGLLGALLAAAGTLVFVRPYAGRAMALSCGLFVGLCPILSFHSRDSTNYALDPMTGAFLLGALAAVASARRGAGLLLAFALTLGSINDYYFFVSVAVAAGLSPFLLLRSPDRRSSLRSLAIGWVLYLAAIATPAWKFLGRLNGVDSDSLFSRHADPTTGPAAQFVEALSSGIGTFGLAYLEGYEAVPFSSEFGNQVGFWLLIVTAGLGFFARCPLRRSAAWLVAGSALLLLCFAFLFSQHTGRTFPVFARNYLTLLPGLAVLWVGSFEEFLGRRWSKPAVLSLLLLLGLVSSRQALNASDSRMRLMERMTEFTLPSDTLMTEVNLELRTEHLEFAVVHDDYCLAPDQLPPPRIWLWTPHLSLEPPMPVYCPDTPTEGYRVRLSDEAHIPPHDRDTNSHLGPIRLYLFDRTASEPNEALPPWTLLLDSRLFSGAHAGHVSLFWTDASGRDQAGYDGPFAAQIDLGPAPSWATHFTLRMRSAPLPEWLRETHLAPEDEHIVHLEQVLLAEDPVSPEIRLPVWAFSNPWLHVVRQILLWVIALSLGGVVLVALGRGLKRLKRT